MRGRPIREEIKDATSLKDLLVLIDEVKLLLLKSLNTDKRTIRDEKEKAYFKGRLQLYCELYREGVQRFSWLQKKLQDFSTYYKKPLSFEELIIDYNWEKTLKSSKPCRKKEKEQISSLIEEEEDDDGKIIVKVNLGKDIKIIEIEEIEEESITEKLKKEIDIIMKKFFNRQNPEVIEDAIKSTLVEFIEKYKEYTTPDILQKAFQELKSKSSKKTEQEKIVDRVGIDGITEPLETIITTTGEKSEQEEITVQSLDEEVIQEMLQDDHQTPFKVDKEVLASNSLFKKLDKEVRFNIVQSLYDGGLRTCRDIVTKVKEDFEVIHYDDVYNVFTKIKK